MGPNNLQGAHHVAQKSTTTGMTDCVTKSLKFAAVALIGSESKSCLQAPQMGVWFSFSAGTRFPFEQCGQ
jgi:hypothetical protein